MGGLVAALRDSHPRRDLDVACLLRGDSLPDYKELCKPLARFKGLSTPDCWVVTAVKGHALFFTRSWKENDCIFQGSVLQPSDKVLDRLMTMKLQEHSLGKKTTKQALKYTAKWSKALRIFKKFMTEEQLADGRAFVRMLKQTRNGLH